MKIVDSTGRRVKLAGVNWSGGHAERHCVGGLDCQPLKKMAKYIKEVLDFNVVRLTFSLQMFYDDNFVDQKLIKANPELFGKTSMQIFDETIKVLTETGLMIYLNNHTSKSQWCCSDTDGDGLWWTK
jgi:aryl-phospho-beta-D-glucosidase BglC (GH1 family)